MQRQSSTNQINNMGIFMCIRPTQSVIIRSEDIEPNIRKSSDDSNRQSFIKRLTMQSRSIPNIQTTEIIYNLNAPMIPQNNNRASFNTSQSNYHSNNPHIRIAQQYIQTNQPNNLFYYRGRMQISDENRRPNSVEQWLTLSKPSQIMSVESLEPQNRMTTGSQRQNLKKPALGPEMRILRQKLMDLVMRYSQKQVIGPVAPYLFSSIPGSKQSFDFILKTLSDISQLIIPQPQNPPPNPIPYNTAQTLTNNPLQTLSQLNQILTQQKKHSSYLLQQKDNQIKQFQQKLEIIQKQMQEVSKKNQNQFYVKLIEANIRVEQLQATQSQLVKKIQGFQARISEGDVQMARIKQELEQEKNKFQQINLDMKLRLHEQQTKAKENLQKGIEECKKIQFWLRQQLQRSHQQEVQLMRHQIQQLNQQIKQKQSTNINNKEVLALQAQLSSKQKQIIQLTQTITLTSHQLTKYRYTIDKKNITIQQSLQRERVLQKQLKQARGQNSLKEEILLLLEKNQCCKKQFKEAQTSTQPQIEPSLQTQADVSLIQYPTQQQNLSPSPPTTKPQLSFNQSTICSQTITIQQLQNPKSHLHLKSIQSSIQQKNQLLSQLTNDIGKFLQHLNLSKLKREIAQIIKQRDQMEIMSFEAVVDVRGYLGQESQRLSVMRQQLEEMQKMLDFQAVRLKDKSQAQVYSEDKLVKPVQLHNQANSVINYVQTLKTVIRKQFQVIIQQLKTTLIESKIQQSKILNNSNKNTSSQHPHSNHNEIRSLLPNFSINTNPNFSTNQDIKHSRIGSLLRDNVYQLQEEIKIKYRQIQRLNEQHGKDKEVSQIQLLAQRKAFIQFKQQTLPEITSLRNQLQQHQTFVKTNQDQLTSMRNQLEQQQTLVKTKQEQISQLIQQLQEFKQKLKSKEKDQHSQSMTPDQVNVIENPQDKRIIKDLQQENQRLINENNEFRKLSLLKDDQCQQIINQSRIPKQSQVENEIKMRQTWSAQIKEKEGKITFLSQKIELQERKIQEQSVKILDLQYLQQRQKLISQTLKSNHAKQMQSIKNQLTRQTHQIQEKQNLLAEILNSINKQQNDSKRNQKLVTQMKQYRRMELN